KRKLIQMMSACPSRADDAHAATIRGGTQRSEIRYLGWLIKFKFDAKETLSMIASLSSDRKRQFNGILPTEVISINIAYELFQIIFPHLSSYHAEHSYALTALANHKDALPYLAKIARDADNEEEKDIIQRAFAGADRYNEFLEAVENL
ncbi:MAG: hypothetical protein AAFR67_15740, partial [Chloroflexota bacterium]